MNTSNHGEGAIGSEGLDPLFAELERIGSQILKASNPEAAAARWAVAFCAHIEKVPEVEDLSVAVRGMLRLCMELTQRSDRESVDELVTAAVESPRVMAALLLARDVHKGRPVEGGAS